jgi:hypothetical protein
MKHGTMFGLVTSALFGVVFVARAAPDPSKHADHMPHRPGPPPAGSSATPSGANPTPAGSGPTRGWEARKNHGDQGDLAEEFRHHRPKPEEAQAKLGELRATFAARRQAHRELLRADFGKMALSHPNLVAELRKHARRMAFLNRAKLVATTELDDPKRTAALGRIDKLIATEQARHQTALQKLKGESPPSPSASAVASAMPAPAGSTP